MVGGISSVLNDFFPQFESYPQFSTIPTMTFHVESCMQTLQTFLCELI